MNWVFDELRTFTWRNRGNLALVAIIAVGAGVYVNSNMIVNKGDETDSKEEKQLEQPMKVKTKVFQPDLRYQFDVAAKNLLPTLQIKLIDIVDTTESINMIKDLRSKGLKGGGDSDLEKDLWDDIKVSSFTQLFATTYASCALTLLLKIQVSIIAKLHTTLNANLKSLHSADDEQDELFSQLLEDTYTHLYNHGLQTLVDKMKLKVKYVLKDCSVKERVSIPYEEFVDIITSINYSLEQNIEEILTKLIIPPENRVKLIEIEDIVDKDKQKRMHVMSRCWDVVQTRQFASAFSEAVDICFRHHLSHCRRNLFISSGSSISNRPPLASLLPQMKALSSQMLPRDTVGVEIRDVANLASVELLCSYAVRT